MTPRSFLLTEQLGDYVRASSEPPDQVARDLLDETAELATRGEAPPTFQIPPEQGAFLQLLARLLGVRRAVEIGTFTGYSALCVARGLEPGGRPVCCGVSEEWTGIARDAWADAGVTDRIDLRIAPALETIAAMSNDEDVDLV